jgi:hypothetical protein
MTKNSGTGLVAAYRPHPATAFYCFNAWWWLPFHIQSNIYSVPAAVFILTSQWAWYENLVLGLENLYSIIFLAVKKGWDRWIIPQSKVQPDKWLKNCKKCESTVSTTPQSSQTRMIWGFRSEIYACLHTAKFAKNTKLAKERMSVWEYVCAYSTSGTIWFGSPL